MRTKHLNNVTTPLFAGLKLFLTPLFAAGLVTVTWQSYKQRAFPSSLGQTCECPTRDLPLASNLGTRFGITQQKELAHEPQTWSSTSIVTLGSDPSSNRREMAISFSPLLFSLREISLRKKVRETKRYLNFQSRNHLIFILN